LLYPRFGDAVQCFKHCTTSIVTNGKLLIEKADEIIDNLDILSISIIENDVEVSGYQDIKNIQDPEPIIAVPENLAHFLPRSTMYLTKYSFRNLEFNRFKEYKKLRSEMIFQYNKTEKLLNKKAGIGRTIKELKILYENSDIDINKYSELLEKYSTKLNMIENSLENLKKNDKNIEAKKKQVKKTVVATP
ncbi:hypothetical protein LCGC14_1274260, partial [marine sediment metagenome]